MLIGSAGSGIEEALAVAIRLQRSAVLWVEDHVVPLAATASGQGRLYRLPYALAAAGRFGAAEAALKALAASCLTPTGDLRPGPLRDRFTHRWASYPLTVLATGAVSVQDVELARSILGTVRSSFVDIDWGGALGERPEVRKTRRQDLAPTAQLGIAADMVGDAQLVESAVRWLEHLIRNQPQRHRAFFVSTDGGELIVADPDRPGEAGSPLIFDQPGQPIASLGIGAAFLADVAYARRSERLVEMAEQLYSHYELVDPSNYEPAHSAQMCKRAWGASSLLRVTGNTKYVEDLISMVRWFERGFTQGGYWEAPAHLRSGPDQDYPRPADAEITVEFLQHVSLIIGTLNDWHTVNLQSAV